MKNLRINPLTFKVIVLGVFITMFLGISLRSFNNAYEGIICLANCDKQTCCDTAKVCEESCDICISGDSTVFNIPKISEANLYDDNIEDILQEIVGLKDNLKKENSSEDKETTVKGVIIEILNGLVSLIGIIITLTLLKYPRENDHAKKAA